MVKMKYNYANPNNYGGSRNTSTIKYIVIHYTANDGDSDESNAKYFKNNVVKSSAHYFVDDDSITQSVPDNRVAYAVGAKSYKHKYCRNSNSLSIELCDDRKNGQIYPSQATIDNAIALTKQLMNKYNIPVNNVIRHYDVTGKLCPAYWSGNATKNNLWKTAFWNKLSGKATTTPTAFKPYMVKVIVDELNVRNQPNTKGAVISTVKKGDCFTISEVKNGWGKPKWYYDNKQQGWINVSTAYVKKI